MTSKKIVLCLFESGYVVVERELSNGERRVIKIHQQQKYSNIFNAYRYAMQLSEEERIPLTVDIIL
jgi:hypothetical protein